MVMYYTFWLITNLPLILVNAVIYGGAILIGYYGFQIYHVNSRKGLLALVICLLPFLYYPYTMFKIPYDLNARQVEVASWKRSPIPKDHSIKSMQSSRVSPISLVSSGVLESLKVVSIGERKYVLDWGDHCLTKTIRFAGINLLGIAVSRNAFLSCIKRVEFDKNENPPIRLSGVVYPPVKKKYCGNFLGATLSLRWSPDKGGELIDFEEIPYRRFLRSPIIYKPFKGQIYAYRCAVDALVPPDPTRLPRTRLNNFEFVAAALGYNSAQDFSYGATPADFLRVLKRINEEKLQIQPDAIVVLLGQWPSTPESSKYIRSSIRNRQWVYAVLKQLTLFPEKLELLPHLQSHMEDFLAACEIVKTNRNCVNYAKKLTALKE